MGQKQSQGSKRGADDTEVQRRDPAVWRWLGGRRFAVLKIAAFVGWEETRTLAGLCTGFFFTLQDLDRANAWPAAGHYPIDRALLHRHRDDAFFLATLRRLLLTPAHVHWTLALERGYDLTAPADLQPDETTLLGSTLLQRVHPAAPGPALLPLQQLQTLALNQNLLALPGLVKQLATLCVRSFRVEGPFRATPLMATTTTLPGLAGLAHLLLARRSALTEHLVSLTLEGVCLPLHDPRSESTKPPRLARFPLLERVELVRCNAGALELLQRLFHKDIAPKLCDVSVVEWDPHIFLTQRIFSRTHNPVALPVSVPVRMAQHPTMEPEIRRWPLLSAEGACVPWLAQQGRRLPDRIAILKLLYDIPAEAHRAAFAQWPAPFPDLAAVWTTGCAPLPLTLETVSHVEFLHTLNVALLQAVLDRPALLALPRLQHLVLTTVEASFEQVANVRHLAPHLQSLTLVAPTLGMLGNNLPCPLCVAARLDRILQCSCLTHLAPELQVNVARNRISPARIPYEPVVWRTAERDVRISDRLPPHAGALVPTSPLPPPINRSWAALGAYLARVVQAPSFHARIAVTPTQRDPLTHCCLAGLALAHAFLCHRPADLQGLDPTHPLAVAYVEGRRVLLELETLLTQDLETVRARLLDTLALVDDVNRGQVVTRAKVLAVKDEDCLDLVRYLAEVMTLYATRHLLPCIVAKGLWFIMRMAAPTPPEAARYRATEEAHQTILGTMLERNVFQVQGFQLEADIQEPGQPLFTVRRRISNLVRSVRTPQPIVLVSVSVVA